MFFDYDQLSQEDEEANGPHQTSDLQDTVVEEASVERDQLQDLSGTAQPKAGSQLEPCFEEANTEEVAPESDDKEPPESNDKVSSIPETATTFFQSHSGHSSKVLAERPATAVCCDLSGIPRGACQRCDQCPSFVLHQRSRVRWTGTAGSSDEYEDVCQFVVGDRVEVRDTDSDPWKPGKVVSTKPVKVKPDEWREAVGFSWKHIRRENNKDDVSETGKCCERCGCPVDEHANKDVWLTKAKESLRRFRNTGVNTKRTWPRWSRLPHVALNWQPDEVALYVLTEGVFDPRRHGRSTKQAKRAAKISGSSGKIFVSVVCPTSEQRRNFHPLLYENFRSQTHELKELVIVETGKKPSEYLQQVAKEDARVLYRFFEIEDARTQDLSEALWEQSAGPTSRFRSNITPWHKATASGGHAQWWGQPSGAHHMRHCRGKVRGGARCEGWTLGLKRNLACHLARGPAIAHFDDDDLYSPVYLEVMCEKLREAAKYDSNVEGPFPAAVTTLQDWHVVDLADLSFGFVNPLKEVLLPVDMREAYAYGFGFSYVYSQAAWLIEAFADVEWSEDGNFTSELRRKGIPVKLVSSASVQDTDAVAAHSHHRETTSGGEFVEVTCSDGNSYKDIQKSVRMGSKVQVPHAFKDLIPIVKKAAEPLSLKDGEVHPLRRQLANNTISEEVGLKDKQAFMRSSYGRDIARQTSLPGSVNGPQRFFSRGHAWTPNSSTRFGPVAPWQAGQYGRFPANRWGGKGKGRGGAGPQWCMR